MAAPIKPHSKFFNKLFSLLQKTPLNAHDDQHTTESIIASSNDVLFAWDNFSSCFRVSHSDTSSNKDENVIQTLLCSNPPLFHISSIIFNPTEDHVALVGNKGIAIMELPVTYTPGHLYQNGKDKILCKTFLVDERYFYSHRQEKVLKMVWHPGSPNFSHLCMLTSDSTLRVYNIAKPECAFQTLSLCGGKSGSKFAAALEYFISMTFGKAVSTAEQNYTIWPLYLLTEMGNVFVVNSKLWVSSTQLSVEGPLKMFPTAEDNYGSDACDILHLSSSPEALVISTVSGSLIHSILLSAQESEDEYDEGEVDGLPTLYVYDIAKLELILTVSSRTNAEDACDFDFTTRLQLVKDPIRSDCYYCMHSAGVHSIQLPWLSTFQATFQAFPDQDDGAAGYSDMIDDQCRTACQHVLCTQALSDSKPRPLRGLAVLPDNINSTSLLCLLSDFTCIKMSIRNGQSAEMFSLMSHGNPASGDKPPNRRSFDKHIQELLHKNVTNPMIKMGSEQSLSAEQSYHLLARATQVFREQYIHKLLVAKEDLNRRVNSLDMLKEQQTEDLIFFREQKASLTDTARDLAERYEDILAQNDVIIARMDKVMSAIQRSISSLSEAERSFSSHLETRQKDVDEMQTQLDQIKSKHKYQKEHFSKQLDLKPCLNDTQLRRVNELLTNESQQISQLVHQLQGMMSTTQ